MDYKIIFSEAAEKNFSKFERTIKKRIVEFLEKRVRPNPNQLRQPLQGNKKGLWKYRVGDYRIICDIKDNELTVLVIDIGHRREVYK